MSFSKQKVKTDLFSRRSEQLTLSKKENWTWKRWCKNNFWNFSKTKRNSEKQKRMSWFSERTRVKKAKRKKKQKEKKTRGVSRMKEENDVGDWMKHEGLQNKM